MIVVVDNNDGTYTCEVPDGKYQYIITKNDYIKDEGVVEVAGTNVLVDVVLELEEPFCPCENVLYSGNIPDSNITWKICDDTETLCIGGTGVMPSINGAWKDYYGTFTKVVIADGITNVGNSAFQHCNSLVGITIPETVVSIDDFAFNRCTSLSEIIIPESIISIGSYAFYNSGLKELVIPNSVIDIGLSYTFALCYELTSVVIGDFVTTIADYGFYACNKLTDVVIGNSVTAIGDYSFSYTNILNKIQNKSLVPQTINSNVFQLSGGRNGVLEVPLESLSLYQNADVWKDFQNIIGI